jgi:hypothetical protein
MSEVAQLPLNFLLAKFPAREFSLLLDLEHVVFTGG